MMLQPAAAPHHDAMLNKLPMMPSIVLDTTCLKQENERAAYTLSSLLPFSLLRSPTPQGRQRWRRDAGQTTSSSSGSNPQLATGDLYQGEASKQGAEGGQEETREVMGRGYREAEQQQRREEEVEVNSISSEATGRKDRANKISDEDECVWRALIRKEGSVTGNKEELQLMVNTVHGSSEALKQGNTVATQGKQEPGGEPSRPGHMHPSIAELQSPVLTSDAAAVHPISLAGRPSTGWQVLGHLLHGPSPQAYKQGNVEQPTTAEREEFATDSSNAPFDTGGGEAACVTKSAATRVMTTINGGSTSTLQQSSQWLLTEPPTRLSPHHNDGIATRHVANAFMAINKACLLTSYVGTHDGISCSRNNYETNCNKRTSICDLHQVSRHLYKGKDISKHSSKACSSSHKSGIRQLLGLMDGQLADTLVRLALVFVLVVQCSVSVSASSPTTVSSPLLSHELGGGETVTIQLPQVEILPSPESRTSPEQPITKTVLESSTSIPPIDVHSAERHHAKINEPHSRSPPTVAPEQNTLSLVPTNAAEEGSKFPDGQSRVPTDQTDETSTHDPEGRPRANREALGADTDPRYARRTIRRVGTTWELHRRLQKEREEAAARWAPVVWLHPQELYFPGDVHSFLAHVNSSDGADHWERDGRSGRQYRLLPHGPDSEHMHLAAPIDTECCNCPVPGFLHGQRPEGGEGPPVYVHVHSCYAPVHHPTQPSRIQYLLPAHSEGRSMRDQIHGLQHPLPRPPRYRRRRRHHAISRGRRAAQRGTDVAPEAPKQRKSVPVTVHSKQYEEVDQTNTESPLNNFVESNQTSDGVWGGSEEDQKAINKMGQLLKWNKVTLRKPQPKMLNLPEFKKAPRNNKDGRRINDSTGLNSAAGVQSHQHGITREVDEHIEDTHAHQQATVTTETQNTSEFSSYTSEQPATKLSVSLNGSVEGASTTTEDFAELGETEGPVTGTSENPTTHGDSKHDKRNIDSNTFHNSKGGLAEKETVTPVYHQTYSQGGPPPQQDSRTSTPYQITGAPIHYQNTGSPTSYPSTDGFTPNTGDHHPAESTGTGTRGHHFTVTYWFFYPYNQGKAVCTSNVWLLGRVAKPLFHGKCLGQNIVMGNHVGDWEHVSIFFEHGSPKHLYISAHSFGAFYTYRAKSNSFEYVSQDVREGMPVRAEFPEHLSLVDGRLVLYSAKGSHGFWPEQGTHPYNSMVVPLADETARGTRWDTWHNLEVIDTVAQDDPVADSLSRQWLGFRGRWGNPSSNCHPGLLGFCELRDGPTGIPTKRLNFPCNVPKHYTFPNE